jgi:hypothetical protein
LPLIHENRFELAFLVLCWHHRADENRRLRLHYICNIDPVRDAGDSVRLFMPQARYNNARNLPLNRYGTGPFCKFKVTNPMRASGVYVLVVGEELRYVGESADLSARFNMGYGNIFGVPDGA